MCPNRKRFLQDSCPISEPDSCLIPAVDFWTILVAATVSLFKLEIFCFLLFLFCIIDEHRSESRSLLDSQSRSDSAFCVPAAECLRSGRHRLFQRCSSVVGPMSYSAISCRDKFEQDKSSFNYRASWTQCASSVEYKSVCVYSFSLWRDFLVFL